MKTIGSAKLGFPVLVTTTFYAADGRTTTTTQEVLELSKEPLSAALFEVPEGSRWRIGNDSNSTFGGDWRGLHDRSDC